ncbi:MAG: DUF4238 domain-containing protein [Promethearchaeota archaeon]
MKVHVSAPAVYLKYFTTRTNEGRKTRVFVYNKKNKKRQNIQVDKIGTIKNFWESALEDHLQNFEKKYDELHSAMKNDPYRPINPTTPAYKFLVYFMSNMLSRNRAVLNQFENLPDFSKLPDSKDLKKYSKKAIGITLMSRNKSIDELHSVGMLEYKDELITSDNPLLNFGFGPGSLLWLPIDFHNAVFLASGKTKEDISQVWQEWNRRYPNLSANEYNKLEFKQADTFVLYKSRSTIDHILEEENNFP